MRLLGKSGDAQVLTDLVSLQADQCLRSLRGRVEAEHHGQVRHDVEGLRPGEVVLGLVARGGIAITAWRR